MFNTFKKSPKVKKKYIFPKLGFEPLTLEYTKSCGFESCFSTNKISLIKRVVLPHMEDLLLCF